MSENPSPLDESQQEFLGWLEELADLAEQPPGETEEEREEQRERAFELGGWALDYLNGGAKVRFERGLGGIGKVTLEEMEEFEANFREEGFVRAAVGMRVLIDRGYGETEHKAQTTAPLN